ncbi:low molecular weight protein-tyrosine-phosphatase [Aeromicrobium sp. UC242_57]|uniref:low molecular weight protein-tyrosine-phosphatase n=1 Tax=Aeromicrobium sp. UC242_57 TaxID=3374624 RepID=UPI0037B8A328
MTYTVAMVCLGNICRSPIAHVVLEDRLVKAGLDDQVAVVSSGTGGWHEGNPMDPRSADVLAQAGYDPSRHVARTFTTDWYAEYDLLLAMDHSNRSDMLDLAPTVDQQHQVRLFREFDPEATELDDEVPDPYYGGTDGFHHVLAMVERTVDQLVEQLPQLTRS